VNDGVVFNVRNNGPYPVVVMRITSIEASFSIPDQVSYCFSRPGQTTSSPYPLDASWTLVYNQTFVPDVAKTEKTFCDSLYILVPPLSVTSIFVGSSAGIRYYSGVAGLTSNPPVDLNYGTGYGTNDHTLTPASSFDPRGFRGTLYYDVQVPPPPISFYRCPGYDLWCGSC
jgi:hypothetical protein